MKYKIHFCLTTKISHLYEKGENIHNKASAFEPTKIKNGVLYGVRIVFESILLEDKHITARKLLDRVSQGVNKCLEKYNDIGRDDLPSLPLARHFIFCILCKMN